MHVCVHAMQCFSGVTWFCLCKKWEKKPLSFDIQLFRNENHNLWICLDTKNLIQFEWVSEWLNLTAFLVIADSEVHKVHLSRVVIAYTLESISTLL